MSSPTTNSSLYDAVLSGAACGRCRLLRLLPGQHEEDIKCRLFVTSVSRCKYTTLSYVWGSVTVTKLILLNGRRIDVTVNLEAALRYIRRANEAVTIWADALCIDQSNNSEKAQQVAMMGSIYG